MQIKTIDDHEKQLAEFNELIREDFNINRDSIPLEKKKNLFNELVEEISSEFWNLEKRNNSYNLIYKYKTEGISPKKISNYQNPIDISKNLRDCNINPKGVLKDQFKFKSDLGEIKKGNPKSKSEDQISVIQNVENFLV